MMIFALAVDGFKEGDTSFFNCVLWGERAEKLSPMLTKGTAIGVTGRTVIESWEKDGVKHTAPKCHVSDVTILYKPKGEKKEEQGNSPAPQKDDDRFTDSIPF
jgi:single-strand DNA-binding protein